MFMPVGTQGAVKAMTVRGLQDAGARIILGNTYHLWLRPGAELIARRGGLHRFNGWPGPILTDSGGYQVFSLAERRKVEETGVHFRSHLDGSAQLLTPERAVDIQALLGSDIAMVLDECPPHPSTREAIAASLQLTDAVGAARPGPASRRCAPATPPARRRPRRARRSSGSCRAGCSRICGPRAPASFSRSASRAMPSAVSAWGSPTR